MAITRGQGPAIPKTAVESTPPSAGEAPVKKAGTLSSTHSSNCRNSCQTCETMWAKKDAAITRSAVIKSVLESPAFQSFAIQFSNDQDKLIQAALYWAEKCEQWVQR